MSLYNNYFVSEIEKVQEKTSSEQEVRQNVEDGLQDLTIIIEKEQAEVNDTYKEIEGFLVSFEEDYKEFESGVAEAEEYVIAREGEIAEEIRTLEKDLNEQYEKKLDGVNVFSTIIFSVFAAAFGVVVMRFIQADPTNSLTKAVLV